MTEKLTRIFLPNSPASSGLMEWRARSKEEMIASLRNYARHLREKAEAIENATDDEFQIDVVQGSVVQRRVKEVQKSSREGARP